MKTKFLITSAVNSKFGVVPKNERLDQTLNTITSIKDRVPGADVTLIDMCGDPLTIEQSDTLSKRGIEIVTYLNEDVKRIYEIPSQDIVKNLTEMICFSDYLVKENFFDIDRVFKISGRYFLNDKFKLDDYVSLSVDKIIFSGKYSSQFDPKMTGNPEDDNFQYMSRLWSFNPTHHLNTVRSAYLDMIKGMIDRLNVGGYIDIEHLLYRHMPKDHVGFMIPSGLTGGIAPNGMIVND